MHDQWPCLRQRDILEVARRLVCDEGVAAVSVGRLARELEVEPASLYEHVSGTDELLAELAIDALIELALAVRSAQADVLAAAQAYREFALAHTELYRLITEHAVPLESVGGAEAGAAGAFIDTLGPDRGRAVWAFAHGMVELELDERFAPDADLDATWRAGITAIAAAADVGRERQPQR
jgi:AcrR family transcriptional regulator